MFYAIARFELHYQLRNPVFWAATVLFFLLTFGAVAIPSAQIAGGGNVHINSPLAIAQLQLTMSVFFIFVTTAFVANVVVRDDETGFGSIIRSTKVDKLSYMSGRFSGAFLGSALAFLAVPLAIWLASLMPWLDPATLGANRIQDYLISYLVIALPNLLITSAFLFAVACWTRSVTYSYLTVILFMFVYFALLLMGGKWPDFSLGAYLDPFGGRAWNLATRYLSPAEANAHDVTLTSALLENRVLWVAMSVAVVALAVWRFRFAERGSNARGLQRQLAQERELAAIKPVIVARLPAATPQKAAWAQLLTRTKFELTLVFKSPAFWVLAIIGALNLLSTLLLTHRAYDVPIWPRTFAIIDGVQSESGTLGILIAIYYAGEIVWRERERRMDEIVDATPLPNWVFVISKLLAVSGVLLALGVAMTGLEAVLFQFSRGLSAVEPGEWLKWFVAPNAIYLILLGVLSIVVQAVSPNKFVGWGVMLLYLVASLIFNKIGLDHPLYNYAEVPGLLSDMKGTDFGGTVGWWLRLYWVAFGVMLVVLGHLMWRRGTAVTLKGQWRTLPARLRGKPLAYLAGALLTTVALGSFLFYNMDVLNQHRNETDKNRFLAHYEQKYGRYVHIPQPSVTDVKLNVAIFPSRSALITDGSYRYVNATDKPIEDLHIRMIPLTITRVTLSVPGTKLISADAESQYWIYKFDRPLQPGERGSLSFHTEIETHGLKAFPSDKDLKEIDSRVTEHGTYIGNYYFTPLFGVNRLDFLNGKIERRKFGLADDLTPYKLDDKSARNFNYAGMDRVFSDITVSTDADQTPIATGARISDTVANGRRTAHFVSRDAPILNFFSILSANYQVDSLDANGVRLEVYHDPRHSMNVERMLHVMNDALDYDRKNFGPYPYAYARIIEMQDYSAGAQSYPGTIPFNENDGFIMDLRDPKRVDYLAYVTAHELAHQYWFHQVMPADMEGDSILTESLAQYSALMIMKHRYGEEQIRRFLKYEMDNYLQGRRKETAEERPLATTYGQNYIHYNKASVVMFLLQDRLGEDRVNGMLRELLAKYRFKGPPYARSTDLIDGFLSLARTPAERELVLDQLDRITLYDLKATEAHVRQLPDGQFETTVNVDVGKFYSDGKGNERPAAFDAPVDVGVFAARPGESNFEATDVLSMQRLSLHSGEQRVRLVTAKKPAYAAIDPYITFIDRNSNDNIVAVTDATR